MGNVLQVRTFQLQAPIWTSETEITVKNFATIYGDDVEMSGSIQYATLEPESINNQEIISFTGITAVSTNVWRLTGVTRGLDAQPTNGVYGNDPSQARAHASSVDCILSDCPQVWDDKLSKSENETITGLYTFSTSPLVPTPTTASQAATKDYVDGVVASGAADAGTWTKGITRLSYSPTATIGTATMTIANPCVVSFTAHGLTLNDSIQFTTTGALPTGLLVNTNYFVISAGLTADAFQISASLGGAAIATTGSQSGVHTLYKTTPIAIGNQDPSVTGGGSLGTPGSGNKFMTQAGFQAGSETYGTDVGGDDTYVVALTPTLTTYTAWQTLYFKPTTANTGACTVDFWPSVLNIKTKDGNDPQSGVLRALTEVSGHYDGTNFVIDTEDFATTANKGTVEMLTDAEALAGTDETRYINSKQAKDNYWKFSSGVSTKDLADSSTTQTFAHWLWRIPKYVKVTAAATPGTTNPFAPFSVYNWTTQSSLSYYWDGFTLWYRSATWALLLWTTSSATYQSWVITFDSTNITITWTRIGGVPSGIFPIIWEAQ